MSTTGILLFHYIEDYEVSTVVECEWFQLKHAGGEGHLELYMTFALERPMEFLIQEYFDQLDNILKAYQMASNPWNRLQRFYKLKHALINVDCQNYDKIVDQDYPNTAEKTDVNYKELWKQLIMLISDYILSSNNVNN